LAESRVCRPEGLESFVGLIFQALGADEDVSAVVASHLVRANLSGHDSHGVIRLSQYVEQADSGDLVPTARPVIARETTVTALVDARRGFGPFSTGYALDWTIERAAAHGIAAAAVRHSSHIGRLGDYTETAAERGFVSIVTVGMAGPGVGGMVLYGGQERFFGANPWSIGVPTDGGLPMVFDGSTSAVAEGKVRVARAKGVSLPPGCIIDRNGNPSTSPDDFYAGGALVPLGGQVAGHKGYGLALASALVGALAMIDDPEPSLAGASVAGESDDPRGRAAGVFVIAIDPSAFGELDHYRSLVGETLAAAKRVPPAPGFDEVLVPGELETRTRASRGREGITIPDATWQEFDEISRRFRVPLPASSDH
jgi:hydroxycarboxylate dehydrogenase B